jgi:uncharacterized UPF0160 family protein
MITLVKNIDEANYVTHAGTMHADELFATAFLELYKKEIKLFRTNQVNAEDYKDKIIYDIGFGEFDHHMPDAKTRPNGIKYSSFGLLWEKYGKDYLIQESISNVDEVFDIVTKDLVEQVDANDNGQFPKIETNHRVTTLPDIFKLFNPKVFSDEQEDIQFIKAVNVAKTLLEEEILYSITKVETKKIILDKLKDNDKKYLILDKYLPYEETLLTEELGKDILFVIYPSKRGGYAIKTVPKSMEDRSLKLPFPKEWKGLRDKELEEKSNIKGLIFCHNSQFIATTTSLDVAIEVVNKVIEKEV